MKKMAIILCGVVLLGCSKSDKEQLIGEWKGNRIYKNGSLMCTYDRAEQDRILDKKYNQEKEVVEMMGLSEYDFKQNMIKAMEKMLQMQFNFRPTDTVYIKTDDSPFIGEPWTYKIIEDSNMLVMEEPSRRVRYLYKVDHEKLVLKNENMRIEFVRNN
jgi:Zn ribbon nucleic-acid-binding protein